MSKTLTTNYSNSNLLNIIFSEAHAVDPFSLMGLLVVSIIAIVAGIVSLGLESSCKADLKEANGKMENILAQCKRDRDAVLNSSKQKDATDTFLFLKNINSKLDEIFDSGSEYSSCKEAVRGEFEYWEIFGFSSCEPELSKDLKIDFAGKMCETSNEAMSCIRGFEKLSPQAVNNQNEAKESFNKSHSLRESNSEVKQEN